MGTWAAGPFGNDMAADFVAGMVDRLMEPIDAFLAEPEIDETFDQAFAAVALLNEVMTRSPARPWDRAAQTTRAAEPIVTALVRCFDEQIGGMGAHPSFEAEQRAALVAECERFERLLGRGR
jgi:hypothetical protein